MTEYFTNLMIYYNEHFCCVFSLTERSRAVLQNATRLIATGSFLITDPDRIILKRVVLTGIPFKISKKSAVM